MFNHSVQLCIVQLRYVCSWYIFLLINTLFLSLPFEISPMCNSGKLSFLLYSNDPHFLNLPYILLERNRRKLHFKLIHFPTYIFLFTKLKDHLVCICWHGIFFIWLMHYIIKTFATTKYIVLEIHLIL